MLRIFKQYYPIRNIFFVISEGLLIYLSFIFSSWILLGTESFSLDKLIWLKILLVTAVCQTCLYYNDLYDLQVTDSAMELGIRLFQSLGAAVIFMAVIYIISPETIIGTEIYAASIAITIILIVSWRFCYTLTLNHGMFNKKIIMLGSGRLAHDIMNEIFEKKDCGYTLSVNIQESSENKHHAIDPKTAVIYKKDYKGLCEIAKDMGISKIVVALAEKRGALPTKELLKCRVNGVDILEGASFYEMLTGRLLVEHINPAWLIFSEGFYKSSSRRFIKRSLDLILSFIMLITFLPIIVVIAILIKIDSPGPIYFSQERVGENIKT